MEARAVEAIPEGEGWQYEPKWDGFRCLAFRDGETIVLQSKNGQPLTRYFPEVVAAPAQRCRGAAFVLDGEIVISPGGALAFDALLQRIHPAARRDRATVTGHAGHAARFRSARRRARTSLLDKPLSERRRPPRALLRDAADGSAASSCRPRRRDSAAAREWLTTLGAIGLRRHRGEASRAAVHAGRPRRHAEDQAAADGRLRRRRLPLGRRRAQTSARCCSASTTTRDCSITSASPRASPRRSATALTRSSSRCVGRPGFTGRAPGGPSRWSAERSAEWEPLEPRLVVRGRSTTTSPAAASATARDSCAGGPTRRRASARSSSCQNFPLRARSLPPRAPVG